MNYNQNKEEHENKMKKGRVVWSEELHHKFVAAVNQLGIDKALPRKILALMNDEKLTKENVSSHLQKYKLHLKRISSSVAPQRKGYVQFPTSGMNIPSVQNVHELPSSARNQFGQNKITNDQLNFQSAIACNVHHNGIMELTEENSSLNQHQVYIMNQHKPKNSCIATNVCSPEYLITVPSSSSQGSQVSTEIAEMRQEMVATRNENHQLREMVQTMMARQDMLIQAVLQVFPPSTINPGQPGCWPINRSSEWMTSFPDVH